MTVCLFGGSYRRRAEALEVEAERKIRKEKVGRTHLEEKEKGDRDERRRENEKSDIH